MLTRRNFVGNVFLPLLTAPIINSSVGCGSSSSPKSTPGVLRLVYLSFDGSWGQQIYAVPVADGNPTALTGNIIGSGFAVSPDGRNIAYIAGNQIRMTLITGSGPIVLTDNRSAVSGLLWSPDSKQIAYIQEDVNRKKQIAVVGLSGTAVVLTLGNSDKILAEWSPDSRQLLYLDGGLYTVQAIGGKPTALKNNVPNITSASWSPDGQTIAFTGDGPPGDPQNPGDDAGARTQVWILRPGGGVAEMLTRGTNSGRTTPFWSPDGNYLAFYQLGSTANRDVILLSLATGYIATAHAIAVESLVWLPDSKKITFYDGNRNALSVMSVTDGRVTRLTVTPPFQDSPMLSPDHKTIAFHGRDDSNTKTIRQIWTISVDGSSAKKLTNDNRDKRLIGWVSDN